MPMESITIRVPQAYIEGLDDLVEKKMYPSRSEAIRAAMRDLLKNELWEGESRSQSPEESEYKNQNVF